MTKSRISIGHTWDGRAVGSDEAAELSVTRHGGGLRVTVEAPYHGDPAPPALPGPCDRLWEFECVELFVAGAPESSGDVPYVEIELSPHGHHLVLRFLGVRNAVDFALALHYEARIDGHHWSGTAEVPAAYVPRGPLRANAYALHGTGPARRYLAATPVPGAVPDFHRPDLFAPILE